MALVFSLSHLSYVSLCSFSDELDHYNFVLRSSLLYWHSHGGPLCLTVACSMQLLKALSPAAQGDTYTEFSSQPIPSGLCIDIVPLILHMEVPSWMCLPRSTSPSHLRVSSVFHMIHPCCTLAAWFITVGVSARFSLFIAQLLGTGVSFIIYQLKNCCFICFVLWSSLATGE